MRRVPLVKSGTDFREFSEITLALTDDGRPRVTGARRIEVAADGPVDAGTLAIVARFDAVVGEELARAQEH